MPSNAALMALLNMRSSSNVGAQGRYPNDPPSMQTPLQAAPPTLPEYGFPQGRPGDVSTAAPNPLGQRSGARSAGLARMLGLPDDGRISQQDMQGEYDYQAAAQAEIAQAEAEQNAYPEQIRGQYGLQQEEVKGQYARAIAEANARAATTERQTSRDFTASQNQLNRESRANAQQTNIGAQEARAASGQAAILGRQRELAATPTRPKPEPTGGFHPLDALSRLFGGGSPAVPPGTADGSGEDPQVLAQQLFTARPGAPPEELAQHLQQSGMDPALIPGVVSAYQQLGSR